VVEKCVVKELGLVQEIEEILNLGQNNITQDEGVIIPQSNPTDAEVSLVPSTGTGAKDRMGGGFEQDHSVSPGQPVQGSDKFAVNLTHALAVDQGIADGGGEEAYLDILRQRFPWLSQSGGIQTRMFFQEELPPPLATPAGCIPTPTPVPILLQNLTAGSIVFPECTLVNRCGGCCSHPLLACQPVDKEMLQRQVIVVEVALGIDRRETISLEQHQSCSCQCKVKEHHCNSLQEYKEDECRCACHNLVDRRNCWGPNKLWDDTSCVCRCRNSGVPCSTGMIFNPEMCRCESRHHGLKPFAQCRSQGNC